MGARDGSDYPAIVHISLPVEDFIDDPSAKAGTREALIAALARVDASPDDLLVIACNTAHLLLPDLQAATVGKFVSLIDTTVDALRQEPGEPVGLLASPTTIRSRLYDEKLQTYRIPVVLPTAQELRKLQQNIRSVIAGKEVSPVEVDRMAAELRQRGATRVVLGCTELSVICRGEQGYVDPLDLILEKLLG